MSRLAARISGDSSGPIQSGAARRVSPVLSELCQGLHLLRAARGSEISASVGFLLALFSCLPRKGVFVWVVHDFLSAESGSLYGPGLWQTSGAVEHLVYVAARNQLEMFWAIEEAVSSPVVAGVAGVFHCREPVDLKFTRRISLRCEKSGVPAYLLTVGSQAFPTAATTHWHVSHAPSQSKTRARMWVRGGAPCWKLVQEKNKKGSCARLTLEYDPSTASLYDLQSKIESRRSRPVRETDEPVLASVARGTEKAAGKAVVVPFAKPLQRGTRPAREL